MFLRNYILLSAIVGLALCIRVFENPKLRGANKQIGRKIKNAESPNKISSGQMDERDERQRPEEAERQLGGEQVSNGLSVFLKGLRADRQFSPDGDRVQFQIQGHKGPRTYIFGFDTGHGKNRQFRLEEMLENGTVTGQYGYYDSRGKLRTVEYVARPFEGYKEKHHQTNVS